MISSQTFAIDTCPSKHVANKSRDKVKQIYLPMSTFGRLINNSCAAIISLISFSIQLVLCEWWKIPFKLNRFGVAALSYITS